MNRNREEHRALVNGMADKLGLDLDELELRGELAPEFREELVDRCIGCSDMPGCKNWLAEFATPQPQAPEYCRNWQTFDRYQ